MSTDCILWQPRLAAGWRTTSVKRLYDIELGKMLQNEPVTTTDVEVPYLKAQHVQWGQVRLDDLPTMYASPAEVRAITVTKGDLLVCEGGEVGRAGILNENPPDGCIIQNALHRVRGRNGNDVCFLGYLLRHAADRGWFDVLCNRATIAHFTGEKFGEMPIHYPPPDKQRAIAECLDRETRRLDGLVAAKERWLALLAEKRRALITRAVTRGLNGRDTPVRRLKFLLDGIDTGFTPQSHNYPAQEGQCGVLKSGCVNGGVFDPAENKLLAAAVVLPPELEVRVGDVLMSRASGSTDLIGSVALVREQPLPKLYLSDKTFRLRVQTAKCDPVFLVLALGSVFLRDQIKQVISGAEGLANNIAQSDIFEFLMPSPPLAEQRAIVAHIAAETAKLGGLRAATERTIALLKERRAALIAAAVTGRLPVHSRS